MVPNDSRRNATSTDSLVGNEFGVFVCHYRCRHCTKVLSKPVEWGKVFYETMPIPLFNDNESDGFDCS